MAKSATATAVKGKSESSRSELLENRKTNKIAPHSNVKPIRVNLDTVYADPAYNGRRDGFRDEEVQGLAESIRGNGGLIQPITIANAPDKLKERTGCPYILIAGFRRFHALQLLDKEDGSTVWSTDVPASLQSSADPAALLTIQLSENIQRLDMNPMDIANAIERAMDDLEINAADFSRMMGMKKAQVSQYRKLLEFPAEIQSLIETGEINFTKARALSSLDPKQWEEFSEFAKSMSSTAFIELVNNVKDDQEEDGEGTGEESSQRERTGVASIRTKTIEAIYLPKLKEDIEKAKDAALKKELETRKDTLEWVLSGGDEKTALAQYFKPFEEERKRKEVEERAQEESNRGRKLYLAGVVKSIRAALNPMQYGEGQTIPTLEVATAAAIKSAASDIKDGKITFAHGEGDKRKEYTFDMKDKDALQMAVAEAYQDDVKAREKRKAESEKRKAEKKAQEAAGGGEKAAADTPADDSDEDEEDEDSSEE